MDGGTTPGDPANHTYPSGMLNMMEKTKTQLSIWKYDFIVTNSCVAMAMTVGQF